MCKMDVDGIGEHAVDDKQRDRLGHILDLIRDEGSSKKGSILYQGKELEWRAYNEGDIIHIVIEVAN